MDRPIIYPGQVPLETDLLRTNRFAMIALAMLSQDLVGTSTQVSGFTCVPTAPATMAVQVTPGRIYSLQNLDSTAYSSLAADTTHQVVKQGILLDAATLACPAPTTVGFSVNYLIEAAYQDTDTVPVTLPYYNSSNPAQAYSGPANSGAAQATLRTGAVTLVAKVGVAAATGTQVTPAPDAGYVGLFVVTVAYGAASILAGAISTYSGNPGFSINPASMNFTGAKPGAATRSTQSKMRDIVSVADYPGFDPTGATETSTVINLATQASAAFSAALAYDIFMPSGSFLMNGTAYLRSGQTFRGAGHGTFFTCTGTPSATPNFILGSGSGGADSSGSPVEIRDFRTIGGGGAAGVIKSIQAGFTIADIFLTSPGIGLDLQGADGLIYGVEIDQALTGMQIEGANVEITDCNFYLANYGITLISGVHDVAISDCEFEYSQYAAILFPTAATAIRGITLSGCNFTMNQQFGTFLGYIVMQANNSEILATGCTFRNMYNWAINHNTGTSNQLMFSGCIFDGTPSTTGYTSSTTAKVLNMPAGGTSTYDFEGCQFRNLLGEIATLANGISQLTIIGGQVVNCDANAASQKRFNTGGLTDWPKITVDIKGFPYIANTGAAQAIVLPFWGPSTIWKVAVKGNTQTTSNASYAAAEEAIYSVMCQFSGSLNTYVDKTLLWKTPTRTNPGDLGAVVCFGTAPGGAASQAGAVPAGTICISVPTSVASNFDWYAETGT